MRWLGRRRSTVLVAKGIILFIIIVCCSTFLDLMCFPGDCDVAETSNPDWSFFDEVVEGNKMTSKSVNNQSAEPLYFSSRTTDEEEDPKKKKLNVTKKLKSLHLASMDFCPNEEELTMDTVLLAGKRETGPVKRFLAVGIPSITRQPKSYLMKTLTSIFNAINLDEENNVTVVTFLADTDDRAKEKQLYKIRSSFEKQIVKGMLQVIQAPIDYYTPLRDLHRGLGDDMGRVRWRSKQALDYSYLMCYCSNISRYYVQLEDDVLASPSFVSKIIDFISSRNEPWLSLNVARLGYIGKLYPAVEVQNLASYMHLFFNDMPVDWLEPRWKDFRGQDPATTVYRAASLFQHVGVLSSFRPKESQRPNTLKEKFFDQFDHKYRGLNPPADVSSDLVSREGQPLDAYTKGHGYFWGRCGSAGTKVYDIVLKKAAKLQRVVVETGANFLPRDTILRGTLEIGRTIDESNPKTCSDLVKIGEFSLGRIDVTSSEKGIKCIRINVRYQGRWVYFREVNVWIG